MLFTIFVLWEETEGRRETSHTGENMQTPDRQPRLAGRFEPEPSCCGVTVFTTTLLLCSFCSLITLVSSPKILLSHNH